MAYRNALTSATGPIRPVLPLTSGSEIIENRSIGKTCRDPLANEGITALIEEDLDIYMRDFVSAFRFQ